MKLSTILKESFNANEAQLTDESRLMALEEWDSLSHMFFITKLEEKIVDVSQSVFCMFSLRVDYNHHSCVLEHFHL